MGGEDVDSGEELVLNIVKGPYLQWPSQDSVTVMWETSVESSSKVSYYRTRRAHTGTRGKFVIITESEKTVEDSSLCRIHAIRLEGLEAETTYHYRARSTDGQGNVVDSGLYPLKTAVQRDSPFSFAVTAETGGYGDPPLNEMIFGQLLRYRPDFLLIVGDAVKTGLAYEDWNMYLFQPGRELFKNTPFYLCPGNHEQNSPWFYKFVGYPEPKNYYSFDYGNAHFIALDSTSFAEYSEEGELVLTEKINTESAQYDFLVNDLKGCQATWKVVFFHYPLYVSGDNQVEALRAFCPVLEKYGVDLVFNSHSLVYERSHPLTGNKLDIDSGVVYIVAGGAGVDPETPHHKRSWHAAQSLAVPHFLQVIIAGGTLQLVAIDNRGCVFDTLRMTK